MSIYFLTCCIGKPPLEISATDLALLTVVAPEMTDGGTDDGPIEIAAGLPFRLGCSPYNAANGTYLKTKNIKNWQFF